MTHLGGWPVIMGDEWIPEAFDWQETIAKLRQFNNDILVAIWVGPDGKDSEKNIVQVSSHAVNNFSCWFLNPNYLFQFKL